MTRLASSVLRVVVPTAIAEVIIVTAQLHGTAGQAEGFLTPSVWWLPIYAVVAVPATWLAMRRNRPRSVARDALAGAAVAGAVMLLPTAWTILEIATGGMGSGAASGLGLMALLTLGEGWVWAIAMGASGGAVVGKAEVLIAPGS